MSAARCGSAFLFLARLGKGMVGTGRVCFEQGGNGSVCTILCRDGMIILYCTLCDFRLIKRTTSVIVWGSKLLPGKLNGRRSSKTGIHHVYSLTTLSDRSRTERKTFK